MIWVITAGGVVLTLVTALACSALVEVFRQLNAIRASLHMEDLPRPLALRPGELSASILGLPESVSAEPEAVVIFLTTTCSTCLLVAETFSDGSPSTVWFVLPTRESELARSLAASSERLVVDERGAIADRAGLNIAPSVLTLRFGDVIRAHSVSTARQVLSLVPSVAPRLAGQTVADEEPEDMRFGQSGGVLTR